MEEEHERTLSPRAKKRRQDRNDPIREAQKYTIWGWVSETKKRAAENESNIE